VTPAPPFSPSSPLEQLADWIGARLDSLEEKLMALDASFVRMQAAVTELASDITAANDRVTERLTAMQATLDAFVASDATEDAAYEALIADLRAQLAGAVKENEGAAARIDTFSSSIEQASGAVEGIAPKPAP
jgi:chromosome segregation ATPase